MATYGDSSQLRPEGDEERRAAIDDTDRISSSSYSRPIISDLDREEASSELERIVEAADSYSSDSTLLDLSKVVIDQNRLNPKTRANLIETYVTAKRFSRPVPTSPTNAPRYISLQAYNYNALANPTGQANGFHGPEDGLIIRVTREPASAIPNVYDQAVVVEDITNYAGSNFVVAPNSSSVMTAYSDATHLYLVYKLNAFNVTSGSYNYVTNNGMVDMKIRVRFQSSHAEEFDIKAPVGVQYSSGLGSLMYIVGAMGSELISQRVQDCNTEGPAYYAQSQNIIGSSMALAGTYGILTQWTPVVDPTGSLQDISMYTQKTSPLLWTTGTHETNFIGGADSNWGDLVQLDNNTANKAVITGSPLKQEIHRIDTVLQNQLNGATPLIAGQGESYYTQNFTPHTNNPYSYAAWMYEGTVFSSFSNTVAIIDNQSYNQLFTYTVYYGENLVPCGGAQYTYNVCTDNGPDDFTVTGKDCLGNTIPTTHLPGGSVYNAGLVQFNSSNCCSTPCTLESEIITTDATFGNNDGFISWSVLSTPGNYSTFTGNPFNTNGFYTVTIASSNGSGLTGTNAAAGGSNMIVNFAVNNTAGTENIIEVSGGGNTDQIVPGMQIISGHTFYSATSGGTATTAYVGDVVSGNLSQNVTKFYVVDENGTPLYSQSANSTVALTFGTGYEGLFGALAPNNAANPFYIISITDEDGCQEVVTFVINEETPPSGCTDSTAVNYDATAVNDDGSCILCSATNGLLFDPVSNPPVTTSLFDSFAFSASAATHNTGVGTSTTHNTDGQLFVSANVVSSVASYLDWDANSKFEILLYKTPGQGQPSTVTGASLISTINAGTLNNVSNAAATITGLNYGYYTLRFRYVDSNSTSTMEDCYSEFYAWVPAQVCDDNTSANYMTVPSNPDLRESTPSLCTTTPCCIVDVPYRGAQCTGDVNVDISCNPARILSPIYLLFSYDGTAYQLIGQQFTSGGPTVGSTQSFTFAGAISQYGAGYYKIEIDAYIPNSTTPCFAQNEAYLTPDTFGCTDSTALNYDPNAECDDGSCFYESYECDGQGNCYDPGDGSGTYATFAVCEQNCPDPDIFGCTDPCANNFDPTANVDNGSCVYRACLDPAATNYLFSCDCNTSKPNATINDQDCCISPCQAPETITATTTDATNTCTTYNNDGSVSISFTNNSGASNWTFEIFDAVVANLIYADPVTYQNPTTVTNTYSGLISGVYMAKITNSFGCEFFEQFTINGSGPDSGCTDPTADNYDPNAECDDGTCFICGCPDPNAKNYNPNATTICPCEYDVDSYSPCVPKKVNEFILKSRACLVKKGSDWLFDYKLGRASDCPIMDKWKLILIEYLLTQDKQGIDCLYNCVNVNVEELGNQGFLSCNERWIQGGPSTGLNHDPNHAGAFLQPGGGTVVTSYDGYPNGWFGYKNPGVGPNVVHYQYTGPARSNLTYVGDMVKFDLPTSHPLAANLNGTIWELTTLPPATTTWNTMGGHQGCLRSKIKHYTKCGDYTKIDVTDTTNYYEKFLNFVNKFCRDCNISILNNNKIKE